LFGRAKPLIPGLLGLQRNHVATVEHQQVLLATDPALQPRMPRRQGDARIPHLNHQIHLGQGRLQGLFGLGDVAWIPLNLRGTHQGTTSTGQGAS
jgi:hypothetical protein